MEYVCTYVFKNVIFNHSRVIPSDIVVGIDVYKLNVICA